MTRVSDALERAARRADTAQPADAQPVPVPSEDVSIDLWPQENPVGTVPQAPELSTERQTNLLKDESEPSFHTLALGNSEKLVSAPTVDRGSVEQYRRLAARLHLSQTERGTRSVMITSALAGEGKTLTSTNLALTLSDSYKRRVLLIDADLRRPGVHELFKLPNVTGLNDGIRSDDERKVPLIRVSEYLSIVTAGRPDPDPMSVLSSDRMRRVLADAARTFDWVIVDTPPVVMLSDAHLLATLVDTVVMVVEAAVTPLRAMKQAVEAVGRDRIFGVVLNCADQSRHGAYEYYNYGHGLQKTASL